MACNGKEMGSESSARWMVRPSIILYPLACIKACKRFSSMMLFQHTA